MAQQCEGMSHVHQPLDTCIFSSLKVQRCIGDGSCFMYAIAECAKRPDSSKVLRAIEKREATCFIGELESNLDPQKTSTKTIVDSGQVD